MPGACPVCGDPVETRPRGRPSVYCSRACQAKAYRTRKADGAAGAVGEREAARLAALRAELEHRAQSRTGPPHAVPAREKTPPTVTKTGGEEVVAARAPDEPGGDRDTTIMQRKQNHGNEPVYFQIRQGILDGGLAQGQQLVESSLSEMFSVSRTPIREALHRLEQDGLVERTDRGLRVSVATERQILEMYRARILLEGAISEDAARNRTDYDLAILDRCLSSGVTAESSPQQKTQDNDRFHEAVWAASHNRTLVDLVSRVDIHLRRYPQTTLLYPGRWERAVEQHVAIAAAIRDRDPDRARRLSEEHHSEAREIRLRLWQDNFPPA